MFKKQDLINKFTSKVIDNGPSNDRLDKKVTLDLLKNHFTPTVGDKSEFIGKLHCNKDLATKPQKPKFESRYAHDIRSITDKVIFESESNKNNPNALRLDLRSIVMGKLHSKFSVTRNNKNITVEMLYPNANGEITVKLIHPEGDEHLFTVNLEDSSFINNFGSYILQEVDKLINRNNEANLTYKDPETNVYNTQPGGDITPVLPSLGGYAPVWESKWIDAFALVEADDDDETDEVDIEAPTPKGGDTGFSEEDFSVDTTGDTFKSDFGGSGSLSELGGGMVDPSNVNSDNDPMGGESVSDEEQMKIYDPTGEKAYNWSQASLDSMAKNVAYKSSTDIKNSGGVVLSNDQILNGFAGIRNDMPITTLKKFVTVHSDLDGIDIPVSALNALDDFLSTSPSPEEVDLYIKDNLSTLTGVSVVDDTLNNEMFQPDQFSTQSPDESTEDQGMKPFDEFVDDFRVGDESQEVEVPDGVEEDEADKEIIRKIATKDMGFDLDEFTNLR